MSQFKKYLSTHYVLLITVATYLLYLITLNPSVTLGDTPEFIAAAYEGGVPHPTGYPLFTLVGHLIGYLPIGTMAEKINSVSALFGALTVGVTASLIYAVSKSKIAALFGSTSLALAFSFWLYAIHAEVYTMHTFFIALMLLFSMLFHQTKSERYVYFLSLTLALSLTNHFTIIMLVPSILYILAINWKRVMSPKTILISLSLFISGLLPYLYLPLAAQNAPVINWNNPSSLSGFIDLVTRKDYNFVFGHQYASDSFFKALTTQLPEFAKDTLQSFGVAFFISLCGLVVLKVKRENIVLLLALLFLGPVTILYSDFSLSSPFPDVVLNQKRSIQQLYLNVMPVIAVYIGLGYLFFQRAFSAKVSQKGLVILVLALLVCQSTFHFSKIQKSTNSLAYLYSTTVLDSLPKHSILLTGNDEALLFWYLQIVEKKRPDVRIIVYSMMQKEWYVRQLKDRYPDIIFPFNNVEPGSKLDTFLAQNFPHHPMYLSPMDDQSYQAIPGKYKVVPEGLSVKVYPEGEGIQPDLFKKQHEVFLRRLFANDDLLKRYSDLPTQEMQMTIARLVANGGWYYATRKDTTEALKTYEKARLISNAYYLPTERIASLYLQQDPTNYGRVIPLYEEILTFNPRHTISLRNLGVIYLELGRKDQAKEKLKRYLDTAPASEEKEHIRSLYLQMSQIPI